MGKSFRRMKRKIRCRLRYGKECPHGRGHCRTRAIKVTAPTLRKHGKVSASR